MQTLQSPGTYKPCLRYRGAVPRSRNAGSHRRQSSAVCAASSGEGLSYKAAGVDIDAGNELVNRIKKYAPNIGGFGGFFPFGDSFLVAGTDGVGTKLELAIKCNNHSTIGIDLVAMCVNDIVTSGAKPLFFLDYYATGKLNVDVAEQVVKGIVDGCAQCDCALLGGETAEMPGFYDAGKYDLAGFAVGAVKRDRVIDGSNVVAGDVILGMKSSGVHSNGFSLVRRVLSASNTSLDAKVPWGSGTFGDVLLKPTIIYVNDVLKVHDAVTVKAAMHITGEGLPGNVPRCLPKNLIAQIHRDSWQVPEIFKWMQASGNIADPEMFRTFNMGVGMVLVVAKDKVDAALATGVDMFVLGEIVDREAGDADIRLV